MNNEIEIDPYQQNFPSSNFLSNLDKAQQKSNHTTTQRCRICLDETGQLIQLPCACIGQLGLVHEKCFSKWVSSSTIQRFDGIPHNSNLIHLFDDIYEIPCQICTATIRIQIKQQTKCIKCKELPSFHCCSLVFLFLFALLILIFLIIITIIMWINSNNDPIRRIILIIIMLIILAGLVCIVKKVISSLLVKDITGLKIVGDVVRINNYNKTNDVQIEHFDNQNRLSGEYGHADPQIN